MGRFDKKEPKLNEVKAALQRLQGFPEEPAPVGQQPAGSNAPPPRNKARIIGAVLLLQAIAVLGAAYLFANLTTPETPQTAAVSPTVAPVAPVEPIKAEAVKRALEMASGLMAQGQVRAAREQLLMLAKQGSSDAAWHVARSYDPNVLATIPQADAKPDIPEATRWYRAWHDAGVKAGTVQNTVSVERIITSMQNAPKAQQQ